MALHTQEWLAVVAVLQARRAPTASNLSREDLEIGANGFATVGIRRGKSDPEGQGAVAPITPDALRHLQAWIDAAGPLLACAAERNRKPA